jgi:hypothetical protein
VLSSSSYFFILWPLEAGRRGNGNWKWELEMEKGNGIVDWNGNGNGNGKGETAWNGVYLGLVVE